MPLTDRHRAALGDPDSRTPRSAPRLSGHERRRACARPYPSASCEALEFGYRERVTDMEHAHIRDLPEVLPTLFADAAARAEQAGFDGVELHYAHAYTMASFLSRTNTRADGYGGSRARTACAFRSKSSPQCARRVGNGFAVGCRFLADECIDGGSAVDDAVYFGVAFARAGMDFLSTSRGGKFDDAKQPDVGAAAYPYTGPQRLRVHAAVHFRRARAVRPQRGADRGDPQRGPRCRLRHAGGLAPAASTISNMAEDYLARGVCDIVGAARQSLADPDWFRKTFLGLGGEVRLCEYTNYCEGLDQKHKPVTCKLWDKLPSADGERRTPDGKRRLTAPAWHVPDRRS